LLDTNALYDFAEQARADVIRARLPVNKSAIINQAREGYDYTIGLDYSLREDSPEHRTDLGHEVGHASGGFLYDERTPQQVRGRCEFRANKWSITHLVPEDELREQIRQGRGQTWELAEYFRVTEDHVKMALCWYFLGSMDVQYYFGS